MDIIEQIEKLINNGAESYIIEQMFNLKKDEIDRILDELGL